MTTETVTITLPAGIIEALNSPHPRIRPTIAEGILKLVEEARKENSHASETPNPQNEEEDTLFCPCCLNPYPD